MNLEVAGKINAGEPVTPPAVPPGYREAANLLTLDCVRP